MEKKDKLIIGGILAAGVIAAIVMVVSSKKHKDKISETDTSLEGGDVFGNPSDEEKTNKDKTKAEDLDGDIMKVGSMGRPVALIQAWLNYKYKAGLKVDGRFGIKMRDAIRKNFLSKPCGYGGIGNSECPLDCSDSLVIEAKSGAKDKKFADYFRGVAKPVFDEFAPSKFCGINFKTSKE